jgi:colicin import membrane protein
MSLASDRPEFTPPPPPGRARAIGLAIFAHILLIAALTWGVNWKFESANAPVQAELWSTTVQQAAPALEVATPPPQPEPKPEVKPEPPQPPVVKPARAVEKQPEPTIDPQIAIEKAKKEEKKKQDKKKADAEAKALAKQEAEEEAAEEAKQEALDKKKRLLEAKKLNDKKTADAKKAADAKEAENDAKYEAQLKTVRDANLKRIAGLASAPGATGAAGATGPATATGEAKQSAGPSAGYEGRIMARIKPNWVFTREINGNLVSVVEVITSSDGRIIKSRISESSGNPAWDDASLRAIEKTEIIPKDIDGRLHSPYFIKFDSRKLL